MSQPDPIDPNHAAKRDFLRMAGPAILIVGVLFLIVGMVNFFSSMGSFEGPKLFWCFFVGMPLLVVGGSMTSMGFMGAIGRYQASEIAPIGKDTFNYVADGVRPGIKSVTSAVMEGISDAGKTQFCTACGSRNDADAKFCKACGHAL
jgi:hypothetical protein